MMTLADSCPSDASGAPKRWAPGRLGPLALAGIAALLVALAAAILLWMGREPICTCGYVKLWHGQAISSENSQHIADWYTFSHIIHGFVFYGLFRLIRRGTGWPVSFGLALLLSIVIESAWEIAENTDAVIDHYRSETISLDYYGDSVLNSVFDIVSTVLGFLFARIAPVWLTVAAALAMELIVGWLIRDNLTLNVIMLLWPMDAIKAWQSGA
jgi:hypothetical protein